MVDLRKLKPSLQYLVALTIMVVISGVAWLVGENEFIPSWIKHYLIPGLGWLGLFLIIIVIVDWIKQKL
jgi:hypothetical protein